jgi:1-acyl-sn-glycerol-3-phosphate acyltransferase
MPTFFLFLYRHFSKHRFLFWFLVLAFFGLSVFFALKINLEEDLTRFIPKKNGFDKTSFVFQNFKFKDKIVINISLKDSCKVNKEKLISYADALADELKENYQPEYIREISCKVSEDLMKNSFESFYQSLPVFLDEKDYKNFDSLLTKEQIENRVKSIYKLLISPAGFALKDQMLRDPFGFGLIALNKIKTLDIDENFELYEGHVFAKNNKNLLVFITSSNPGNETAKNAVLIEGIEKSIDKINSNTNNEIHAEYFGGIAVGVSNARQIKTDSIITTSIAIFVLVVVLWFFFRKKRIMGFVLLPVLFGTVFSLAIMYLLQGSISALALGSGSVILGIAINYSLHVFTHYKHTHSPEAVITDLSNPLTIGGATTIGAFLCLMFTSSEALKDFGLFSAFSLIGAALFSLIVLPHVLVTKADKHKTSPPSKPTLLERFSEYKLENNRFVVLPLLAILLVCFFTASNVEFESNMMSVNYYPENLKEAENNLNKISDSKYKSVYLISTGKDLKEALNNSNKINKDLEKLKKQGFIKKYASVNSVLLSDSLQRIRIKRWNTYWTNEKKTEVRKALIEASSKYKFRENAFDKFYSLIEKNYEPVDIDTFDSINKLLTDNWISKTPELTMLATIIKVENKDKEKIINGFKDYPDLVVFDKQYLAAKVAEIINNDFNLILLLSSALVFLFLLISYGRIELAIVAFLPMLLSWILILGLMSIFGLKFNIINIIISTFIFGLGDDYSIFILDGLLEEFKTGKKNLASYKTSVYLSAITMIVGVGVLIFATHPALKSIALVTIIGMFSVVLISNTIIPILFRWMIYNKKTLRSQPVTFFILIYATISYGIYLLGCLLVVICGFLSRLIPVKRKTQKFLYHWVIMQLSHIVMFIMYLVKKRTINKKNIDFSKPYMIITNHQSIIDLPLVLTFTPKLIILTADWVWNSPLLGKLVRMADFYPLTSGLDNIIPLLQEKVKDGYSILLFPEGTRSPNLKIKRFHKGAFYLSEKLKIDVLPVVFNGTADYVSKGELLGKKSTITLKFLNPISYTDTSFGTELTEKTRNICAWFRKEYEILLNDHYKKTKYYADKLIKNYIYKGPIIEWYLRSKLRFEKNYEFFHKLVPASAKIYDIGCSFGFLSYMLSFLSEKRIITGIDYDQDKIAIANKCRDKNERIEFICEDAINYEYNDSDVFILSDVLHYMPETAQQQLVEKCISKLNDGGLIIIRDADNALKNRHLGTKITEFFSTRFGFNKTQDGNKQLYFLSRTTIQNIIQKYDKLKMEIFDHSVLTSNVIFVIKKQAG